MKICFIFLGNIKYDSRSYKEFKTLQEAGNEAEMLGVTFNKKDFEILSCKIEIKEPTELL